MTDPSRWWGLLGWIVIFVAMTLIATSSVRDPMPW